MRDEWGAKVEVEAPTGCHSTLEWFSAKRLAFEAIANRAMQRSVHAWVGLVRVEHVTDAERGVALLHTVDDAPVTPTWLAEVLARDDHALFGAYDADGAPIGFLYGYELGMLKRDETEALLYEIEVVARSRRQGVGRALVNTYLAHCRSRGVRSVWVPTDNANQAALGLYGATGAVPFEQNGVLLAWDLVANE